eukprot:NODE_5362_length_1024_cov_48.120977_g4793_i0.p1 GENE.NODE_5362_length_1024_cov_48.120977_g4793_i0~~NODE_5362_length_1024_cov_48.120977_g4793_i0.p1  ORF type:complete len:327 (+),score=68.89 NODE_5362_length_1024_cov_48.120977_g4793_i0:111-983(+)
MSYHSSNIVIRGEGTIDGQGDYWWKIKEDIPYGRPRLIEFMYGNNIEVTGVTLKNPGFWTLHPIYCKDVWIHGITVDNPFKSPNTDGIDPDSSWNVMIENNDISCGDDYIAIKSGLDEAGLKFNMSVSNITVRNNIFRSGDGISIGSETSGGVFGVYVYNNTVVGPATHGLQIKTAPARGNIIDGIHFWDNIIENAEDKSPFIYVNMFYDNSPPANPLPILRNVFFENIRAKKVGYAGEFLCLSDSPCTGIHLSNITVTDYKDTWKCQSVKNSDANLVQPDGLQKCFDSS